MGFGRGEAEGFEGGREGFEGAGGDFGAHPLDDAERDVPRGEGDGEGPLGCCRGAGEGFDREVAEGRVVQDRLDLEVGWGDKTI